MTHSFSYPLPLKEITRVLFQNKKRRTLLIQNESNGQLQIWLSSPKRFKSLIKYKWVRESLPKATKTGKLLRWLCQWNCDLTLDPGSNFELNIFTGDVWASGVGRGSIVLIESDGTFEIYIN